MSGRLQQTVHDCLTSAAFPKAFRIYIGNIFSIHSPQNIIKIMRNRILILSGTYAHYNCRNRLVSGHRIQCFRLLCGNDPHPESCRQFF